MGTEREGPAAVERMEDRHASRERRIRSLTKAMTYRILIGILHFTAVFLLTGMFEAAVGFTLLSSVYTSIAYYVHERLWDRMEWGRSPAGG